MAGLWTTNHRIHPGQDVSSATVITVPANDDTRGVHDRMPAMQWTGEEVLAWLADRGNVRSESDLQEELAPAASGSLQCRRVSRQVNRAQVDLPGLILPDDGLFES